VETGGFVMNISNPTLDNYSSVSNNSQTVSYSYTSLFGQPLNDSSTNTSQGGILEQSFSYSTEKRPASFGLPFDIPPSSIKWTINISTSFPLPEGLAISYQLNDLSPTLREGPKSVGDVSNATNSTTNITTYLLPLEPSAPGGATTRLGNQTVAQLEVFGFALVDGDNYVGINHSLVALDGTSNATTWLLELRFPPFKSSLKYDPTVGLAVLLPTSKPTGSSGYTLYIIVAIVLIISGVVVVVGVVGVTASVLWRRKIRKRNLRRIRSFL